MYRDSTRCATRSNDSCGTNHESYTADTVWVSDVLGLLNRVLEHSLRYGLDTVYNQTYEAAVDLYGNDYDDARLRLSLAIPACDERSKSLIRDALQLLKGIETDGRRVATDGGRPQRQSDALTDDDLQKLQQVLEKNRRHGNDNGGDA